LLRSAVRIPPPITPTEASHADDSFLGEQAFGAILGDQHLFKPAQQSDLHQILTSFGSRRKLIVGMRSRHNALISIRGGLASKSGAVLVEAIATLFNVKEAKAD
jgi:hypothetical protein